MRKIETEKAPAAIGPYSQAIVAGDTIYTSGSLGINPATGLLEGDIREQTSRALGNLLEILNKAGFEKTSIVKSTIFLKSLADFTIVNEIYAGFFGEHKPARTTVEVSNLPKNALIEIDMTGVKKS